MMEQMKEIDELKAKKECIGDSSMGSIAEDVEAQMALAEVLDELPDDKRHRIVCAMMRQTSYRGPLPHPEILKGYENILPGAAERVFAMAESQQKHRMAMEETIVKNQIKQSKYGQIWGGLLTILFGVISFVFAYLGYPTLAGITLTTTIISLATIFVLNKMPISEKSKDEHEEYGEQEQ